MRISFSGMGVSCGVHELGALCDVLADRVEWVMDEKTRKMKMVKYPADEYEGMKQILAKVGREEVYSPDDDMDEPGCACAFITFSDNKDAGCGTKLAKYIRKHRLGGLTQTPWVENPNSNNLIRVWVWAVNRDAVLDHLLKKYHVDIKTELRLAEEEALAEYERMMDDYHR
jgi:hypothetical protein